MEGGGIPPTRALSLLLPKGEVLLFRLIKKKKLSAPKGNKALEGRREEKVMFDRLEPESQSQTEI